MQLSDREQSHIPSLFLPENQGWEGHQLVASSRTGARDFENLVTLSAQIETQRKPSGSSSNVYQTSEWLALARCDLLRQFHIPGTITDGLEEFYVITERVSIARFIEEHRLRNVLLQARDPLGIAFGQNTVKTLALLRDDEGFETLFCLVMVSMGIHEAGQRLMNFDQWWIARAYRYRGKLSFDFELV